MKSRLLRITFQCLALFTKTGRRKYLIDERGGQSLIRKIAKNLRQPMSCRHVCSPGWLGDLECWFRVCDCLSVSCKVKAPTHMAQPKCYRSRTPITCIVGAIFNVSAACAILAWSQWGPPTCSTLSRALTLHQSEHTPFKPNIVSHR